jgi:hypothetical protein
MACHSGEVAHSARIGSRSELRELARADLKSLGVSCGAELVEILFWNTEVMGDIKEMTRCKERR